MKTDDYIVAALGKPDIQPEILWVTRDIKPEITKILQRSNFPLRYRFYRQNNRTVWILDEIGKVMPITTGITIENNAIINLTVLAYRESHGSEIRFPAYSNQYNTVYLTEDMNLSQPINGISGATLSTNAMKRVSRLALYLHKKVMEKNVPTPNKK
ncbi:MAG: FMN-binding protein [Emcibacter sp.]|nr:FMN-binding protein [Emcibacter sp.]